MRIAIQTCDAVIVLLTPSAAASKAVEFECETARKYGKKLIPLFILPCSIPAFLSLDPVYRDLTQGGLDEASELLANELDLRWAEIGDMLTELTGEAYQEHGGSITLLKCIKYLQRMYDVEPRRAIPPEIFEIWFDILRDFMHSAPDLDDAIERLIDGSYRQSDSWPRYAVFSAQHELYFRRPCMQLRSDAAATPLRVVLFAMTRQEASELYTEAVFEGWDAALREEFAEMRALFDSEDWATLYGELPQQWRPFGDVDTIHDLIIRAAKAAKTRGEVVGRIVPGYTDVRQYPEAAYLRQSDPKSIVVIDYVSTRHPRLQHQFRDSRLGFSRTLPTVRIGIGRLFQRPHDTRPFIKLHFDSEFEKRRRNADPHCAQVSNKEALLDFLGHEIPRVIDAPKGIHSQFNRFEES